MAQNRLMKEYRDSVKAMEKKKKTNLKGLSQSRFVSLSGVSLIIIIN
jgi:hypothetical protein